MKENYAKAEAIILTYEGGYANNPKDPGGPTMKGITQGTYNAWLARNGRASAPVRNISDTDVGNIYRQNYWDKMDCDEMPSGVDLCLFDAAVNSGVGGSTTWAQAVCNVATDGAFGDKTKDAIIAADPEDFIRDFNSRRLATLQRLPTWPTFKKGWSARIANGMKIELAWADASDGPDPVMLDTVGGTAKARVTDIPVSRVSQVGATLGTGVAGAASGVVQSIQTIGGYDSISWIKYVLLSLTAMGAIGTAFVFMLKTWDDQASAATAKAKVDTDADKDLKTVPLVKAPPPVLEAGQGPAPGPNPAPQPQPVVVAAVGTAEGTAHA